MVHAVSDSFERFEHMSPPALVLAALLHALVAAFLLWTPVHHPAETDEAIEVTMEAPPPPPPLPEKKPEPEPPKPPPPVQQAKPPPPQPLPGLAPPGPIGPKSTAPPMERGETTRQLSPPPAKAEPPAPEKAEPPPPTNEPPPKPEPPQQATARPVEPPPPPPPPALEKELPPIEAPPPPVTSRDIPRFAPAVPEHKPEPPAAPRPPQPPVQPRAPPQVAPSPLSRLPRNAPSPQDSEQPRSTFVNPADTYAQNTASDAYLQHVVAQIGRYQANITNIQVNDYAVASFTIARNGGLVSVSVVTSSGNESLDRGLVAAFHSVGPFPPLPADVAGNLHTFTLAFGPRYRR